MEDHFHLLCSTIASSPFGHFESRFIVLLAQHVRQPDCLKNKHPLLCHHSVALLNQVCTKVIKAMRHSAVCSLDQSVVHKLLLHILHFITSVGNKNTVALKNNLLVQSLEYISKFCKDVCERLPLEISSHVLDKKRRWSVNNYVAHRFVDGIRILINFYCAPSSPFKARNTWSIVFLYASSNNCMPNSEADRSFHDGLNLWKNCTRRGAFKKWERCGCPAHH